MAFIVKRGNFQAGPMKNRMTWLPRSTTLLRPDATLSASRLFALSRSAEPGPSLHVTGRLTLHLYRNESCLSLFPSKDATTSAPSCRPQLQFDAETPFDLNLDPDLR